MNWLLTHLATIVPIVLVGAAAALAGWSIGFDQGRDAARMGARPLPTVQTFTGGLSAASLPSSAWHYVTDTTEAAFNRGVLAGEQRERERQRAIRSAAGVKAHATRRNRVTGEVRTVPDATIGANTTGTSAPATLTVYPGERDE